MTLEQIWAQFGPELKAFIHSRLSNPADVEDVLQNVAVKAHENLGTLEKVDRVKSWLFQIANRAVIDQYRQNGKVRDFHPEDLWYGEEDTPANGGLDSCVAQVVQSLPEDVSKLLTNVELNGMSQKAYAENTGTVLDTEVADQKGP